MDEYKNLIIPQLKKTLHVSIRNSTNHQSKSVLANFPCTFKLKLLAIKVEGNKSTGFGVPYIGYMGVKLSGIWFAV